MVVGKTKRANKIAGAEEQAPVDGMRSWVGEAGRNHAAFMTLLSRLAGCVMPLVAGVLLFCMRRFNI